MERAESCVCCQEIEKVKNKPNVPQIFSHRRMSRGGGVGWAAVPPKFGHLRFFWAAREIWAKPLFKEVCMCGCMLFFFLGFKVENLPPQDHGQQRVSNIALINIEREYANSVLNNDIDRTIDIFGFRNGRNNYFF